MMNCISLGNKEYFIVIVIVIVKNRSQFLFTVREIWNHGA